MHTKDPFQTGHRHPCTQITGTSKPQISHQANKGPFSQLTTELLKGLGPLHLDAQREIKKGKNFWSLLVTHHMDELVPKCLYIVPYIELKITAIIQELVL